jgi:hypothetical protein
MNPETLQYTRTCIEWCAQSMAHYEYKYMILIYLTLFVMISYVIFKDHKLAKDNKVFKIFPQITIILLLGFLASNIIQEDRIISDEINSTMREVIKNDSHICLLGSTTCKRDDSVTFNTKIQSQQDTYDDGQTTKVHADI